jgi:hypothetical protein
MYTFIYDFSFNYNYEFLLRIYVYIDRRIKMGASFVSIFGRFCLSCDKCMCECRALPNIPTRERKMKNNELENINNRFYKILLLT